jgi:hypothetical protein
MSVEVLGWRSTTIIMNDTPLILKLLLGTFSTGYTLHFAYRLAFPSFLDICRVKVTHMAQNTSPHKRIR